MREEIQIGETIQVGCTRPGCKSWVRYEVTGCWDGIPRFCSEQCKGISERITRHRQDEWLLSRTHRCPRSEKMTFDSESAASEASISASKAYGTPLSPYECVCIGWHIGNAKWRRARSETPSSVR